MTPPATPRIAYLTAGAAGMFCGSCMHDNTLARGLMELGCDVQLIPLYTPIRTDERSVAIDAVFMGGINVYLQQRFAIFRHLPKWFDRMLDSPSLVRWATQFGMKTTAKDLGPLTVSILKGDMGFQRKEVDRLVDWLANQPKPDIVNLTNMLIAGVVPAVRKRLGCRVVATLQGDDIFLDDLVEPYKSQALKEIERLHDSIDLYVTHSEYYADYMSEYLRAPRNKFKIVPLGIDSRDFVELQPASDRKPETLERPPVVGYLARLAPEKGLHILVDAFLELRKRPGFENAKLKVAGWLGAHRRAYAEEQFAKLRLAGADFEHVGEVDRTGKQAFLRSIDVLSVPTTYREPKGLFVLEALACGVPVVQPEHGAFPELIRRAGGGLLCQPNHPTSLADKLQEILADSVLRHRLGTIGERYIHEHGSMEHMAKRTLDAFQEVIPHESTPR